MGWEFWIQVLPFLVLLPLGYAIGRWREGAHFRRLKRREGALSDVLVTDLGVLPEGCAAERFGLVTGEAVIASDYFKSFAARLRGLIGGELQAFETLMQRARREAILRMMESARRMGANRVVNVRLESSNIGAVQGRRRGGAAMVEMYAYGTAFYVPEAPGG